MDERVKADSSQLRIVVPDTLNQADTTRPIKPKEWITGASIILVLSISLFLLFNTRSQ